MALVCVFYANGVKEYSPGFVVCLAAPENGASEPRLWNVTALR